MKAAVAMIDAGIFVGELDFLDAKGAFALIGRAVPADHPLAGKQAIELLANQGGRAARAIADGAEPHAAHPVGEGRAEHDLARFGAHRFGHDVDQHQSWQRPVGHAQRVQPLLAIDVLHDRLGVDDERVLAVLADDGGMIVGRPPHRQRHRAECGVQEAGGRAPRRPRRSRGRTDQGGRHPERSPLPLGRP